MKRMWIAAVLALVVAAVAATPAGAATGGNSANAKLCQKGGWQKVFRSDGSTFANQGACVSYGAKGNTILTAPLNWQAACEQAGGTFSISNMDFGDPFGAPIPPPGYAYVCQPVSLETWSGVLTTICYGYPDGLSSQYVDDGSGIGIAQCVRGGTA
jgi:hypothetical protein